MDGKNRLSVDFRVEYGAYRYGAAQYRTGRTFDDDSRTCGNLASSFSIYFFSNSG